MSWKPIQVEDLKTVLSAPEWAALNKDADIATDVAACLADTVAACRAMLRVTNPVGPEGQLPDAARRMCLYIARCDVLERWPKTGLLTEPRLKDKDRAYEYFKTAVVTYPESDDADAPNPESSGGWGSQPKLNF